MRKKYDIFISYRRECSEVFATLLKYVLEREGYIVFLDSTELTDGKFDKRIMDAIDSSSVFLFILAPHSLDKCVDDNEDWVRKEIEYAVSKEKHIVPVNPDKAFSEFPCGTPDKLKEGLGQHQFSEIMIGQLFESSIRKMIEDRILPIIEPGVELSIESEITCRLFVFDEEEMIIKSGRHNKFRLLPGRYHLRFEELQYPYSIYRKNIEIEASLAQSTKIQLLEKDFKRQYNHPKPKHSDVLGVIAKHSKQKEINTYSEFDRCFDYESISAELRRFNIFLTGSQIRSYKTVGTLLSNFTR